MNTYTVTIFDRETGQYSTYYITCEDGAEYAAVKAVAEHLNYMISDFSENRYKIDIAEGIGGQFGGIH